MQLLHHHHDAAPSSTMVTPSTTKLPTIDFLVRSSTTTRTHPIQSLRPSSCISLHQDPPLPITHPSTTSSFRICNCSAYHHDKTATSIIFHCIIIFIHPYSIPSYTHLYTAHVHWSRPPLSTTHHPPPRSVTNQCDLSSLYLTLSAAFITGEHQQKQRHQLLYP